MSFYDFLYVNTCAFVSICISHAFSWVIFFSLFCHITKFVCFVLSYFYLILFYYSLDACLFSKERQRGCESGWERWWDGLWRSWRRINYNHNVLYERNLFSVNTHKHTHTYFSHLAFIPAQGPRGKCSLSSPTFWMNRYLELTTNILTRVRFYNFQKYWPFFLLLFNSLLQLVLSSLLYPPSFQKIECHSDIFLHWYFSLPLTWDHVPLFFFI